MSDAQVDGGERGGDLQDGVSDAIGVESAAAAVRWYGIFSLIMGWGMQMIWSLVDGNYYAYGSWFRTMQNFYFPVGMGWIMVSLFDSAFMRTVFRDVVFISILAPFFHLWKNIFDYVLGNFDHSLDELKFWIWLAIMFFGTVVQAVMQILLIPQIFDWSKKTDYLDNDKDNSLLAFII